MAQHPLQMLGGAVVYDEQRLMAKLRDDPVLYEGLREILVRRREQRREQAEGAEGEKAAVIRGRCQELTAIITELFPQPRQFGAPERFNPTGKDY